MGVRSPDGSNPYTFACQLGVLAMRQACLVIFSLVSSLTPLDLTVIPACLNASSASLDVTQALA